jgi:ketol-acid reductoisomerase
MFRKKKQINYFNQLPLRRQLSQLGMCRPMDPSEFAQGVSYLNNANIVVVGCGSQGLNQALCLRDSGLKVSIALREQAIKRQNASWQAATEHKFKVDTINKLIPNADLVINLTPDKQHAEVIAQIAPLMKQSACLSYSHGFNIIEEGQQIRTGRTVIMVAPKGPGTEVRHEYQRGFGVPTLIAVHEENDPHGNGIQIASAYAAGIGADRAGVLESSFVAEVKSDLMGEQTILCGLLQTASIGLYDWMIRRNIAPDYASGLLQYGWETFAESAKQGGISHMMDQLDDAACMSAYEMANTLKIYMRPVFEQHMDNIMSGNFSAGMMRDWRRGDKNLLKWRKEIAGVAFERSKSRQDIPTRDFFEQGAIMVAVLKGGIELAFEVMLESGIKEESAYYESLHELPLIANLIARKKLYEMNRVISDTAEYGCHLFYHGDAREIFDEFIISCDPNDLGVSLDESDKRKVPKDLIEDVRKQIRSHPIEVIGRGLRKHMSSVKKEVA